MSFPTADQIALAVVTACRLTGDAGPVQVVTGAGGPRARALAFAALREAFPEAVKKRLALKVGYRDSARSDVGVMACAALANCRIASWWRDELVDEVVGAIVAANYGEQAS